MTSVSAATGVAGALGTRSASKELAPEDFIKILLSEVRNQNPLEPMKNSDLLNQLTQIKSLEASTKLSDSFQTMMLQQQIVGAGGLIGRLVSGSTKDGTPVSGLVTGVLIQGGQVDLVVGESRVPLGCIQQIASAEASDGA